MNEYRFLLDALFATGQVVSVAFLAYGGYLCLFHSALDSGTQDNTASWERQPRQRAETRRNAC